MNAYWASRSPRERTAIAWAAGLVVLLLVAVFVWLPLERTRARLAADVPRLAASVAAMERQAAEVARIRSLPAVARAAAAPTTTIAADLGRAVPGSQASAPDDKRVRITGSDVAFGALLEAIAAAQGAHGMRVDSARIDALPTAGRVRAEVLLSR